MIDEAMTLEPNVTFSIKYILSNSSIITSLTSVNLKKAGVASRNIVFKKAIHVVMSALQKASDFPIFVLHFLAD